MNERNGADIRMTGMHDHPDIYPTLPGRAIDGEEWLLMVEPNRGTPFQTCWEYVLTHELTESEGAAFWTAANLVHRAMSEREGRPLLDAADALESPEDHDIVPNDRVAFITWLRRRQAEHPRD